MQCGNEIVFVERIQGHLFTDVGGYFHCISQLAIICPSSKIVTALMNEKSFCYIAVLDRYNYFEQI